jgi:hypothetical protein
MYTLIEELARDHQATLLKAAAAQRQAAQLWAARRAEREKNRRLAAVRRSAGRVLIAAGHRLAGAATAAEGRALR